VVRNHQRPQATTSENGPDVGFALPVGPVVSRRFPSVLDPGRHGDSARADRKQSGDRDSAPVLIAPPVTRQVPSGCRAMAAADFRPQSIDDSKALAHCSFQPPARQNAWCALLLIKLCSDPMIKRLRVALLRASAQKPHPAPARTPAPKHTGSEAAPLGIPWASTPAYASRLPRLAGRTALARTTAHHQNDWLDERERPHKAEVPGSKPPAPTRKVAGQSINSRRRGRFNL
jgi:hypothetical protein